MSIEAMAIALHHSKAKGTAKVVLLGIANHDGDAGAFPKIATLAKYANVAPKNVREAIAKLGELGEIIVHEQEGGKLRMNDSQRPNLYEFVLKCPPGCDRSKNHHIEGEKVGRNYKGQYNPNKVVDPVLSEKRKEARRRSLAKIAEAKLPAEAPRDEIVPTPQDGENTPPRDEIVPTPGDESVPTPGDEIVPTRNHPSEPHLESGFGGTSPAAAPPVENRHASGAARARAALRGLSAPLPAAAGVPLSSGAMNRSRISTETLANEMGLTIEEALEAASELESIGALRRFDGGWWFGGAVLDDAVKHKYPFLNSDG